MNLITIAESCLPAVLDGTGVVKFGQTKNGKFKVGTVARVIAGGNKNDRAMLGQTMYANWISKGQFRPLVEDILTSGLMSEDLSTYVRNDVGHSGPVSKDKLVQLCRTVRGLVTAKQAKAQLAGKAVREPKGDKGFVWAFVVAVADRADAEATVIEDEPKGE